MDNYVRIVAETRAEVIAAIKKATLHYVWVNVTLDDGIYIRTSKRELLKRIRHDTADDWTMWRAHTDNGSFYLG